MLSLFAAGVHTAAKSIRLALQAAVAVFERQGVEADVYVRRRLAELGGRPGERLHW